MGAVDVWLLAPAAGERPLKPLSAKVLRFGWRAARNLLCVTPWGRSLLFPSMSLAARFGRADAEYAVSVFLHHYTQLSSSGFRRAEKILEVGPGRNLGTALLVWALSHARSPGAVTVILWDAFPNMIVDVASLRDTAAGLLASQAFQDVRATLPGDGIDRILGMVAREEVLPDIQYRVESLTQLMASGAAKDVDLVYSQAAIEHIWNVAELWRAIILLTKPNGWHSHRIDLADHGRRDTNYIEMLEWSTVGYWLTMRFVPGGINRWRASQHLDFLGQCGMRVVHAGRETRSFLPIQRSTMDRQFRPLDDVDLKTTAIDVVAQKVA